MLIFDVVAIHEAFADTANTNGSDVVAEVQAVPVFVLGIWRAYKRM